MATIDDFKNEYDVRKIGHLIKLKTKKSKLFVLRSASVKGPARLEYYDTDRPLFGARMPWSGQPGRSIELDDMVSVSCNSDGTAPGSTLRTWRQRMSRSSVGGTDGIQFAIVIYTKEDWLTVVCETETEQQSWFNEIMLLRNKENPPYDHTWQVTLMQKDLGRRCRLLPMGVYLFCVNDQMVSLQNSKEETNIDIPAKFIKNVGLGDRCLMIDLGRSAVTGPGKVWMAVADSIMLANIHDTMLGYMKVLRPLSKEFRIGSSSTMSTRNGTRSEHRQLERSSTIHTSQPHSSTGSFSAAGTEGTTSRPISDWGSFNHHSLDSADQFNPSETRVSTQELEAVEEDSSYIAMAQHDPSLDPPAFNAHDHLLSVNLSMPLTQTLQAPGSSPTRAATSQGSRLSISPPSGSDAVFCSVSSEGPAVRLQRLDSRESESLYLNMSTPPPNAEIFGAGRQEPSTTKSRTSSASSSNTAEYCNMSQGGVPAAMESKAGARISSRSDRLSSGASANSSSGLSGSTNERADSSGLANQSTTHGVVISGIANQITVPGVENVIGATSVNSSVETLRGSDSYMMVSPPAGVISGTNIGRSVSPAISDSLTAPSHISSEAGTSYMMMSPPVVTIAGTNGPFRRSISTPHTPNLALESGTSESYMIMAPSSVAAGGYGRSVSTSRGQKSSSESEGGSTAESYMMVSPGGSAGDCGGTHLVLAGSSIKQSRTGENFDEYMTMNAAASSEGYLPMKRAEGSSSSVCSSRSSAGSIIVEGATATDHTGQSLSRASSQLGRAGDSGYMEMRPTEIVAALRPRLSTVSYKLRDKPDTTVCEYRSNSFGSKPLTGQRDMDINKSTTTRYCATVDEGSGGSGGMSISAPHLTEDQVSQNLDPLPTQGGSQSDRGRPPHHPRGSSRNPPDDDTIDDRLMPLDFTRRSNSIHSSKEEDLGAETMSSRSSSGGAKDLPRKNSSLSSMSRKFFTSLFSARKDSSSSSGISSRRKGSSSSSRASSKQRGSRMRADSFGLPTDPRPRAATVENRPRVEASAAQRQGAANNRACSESAMMENVRSENDSGGYMTMNPLMESKGYMDMSFSGSLSRQTSVPANCSNSRKLSVDSTRGGIVSMSPERVGSSDSQYMDMASSNSGMAGFGDVAGRKVSITNSQYMDMNPSRKASISSASPSAQFKGAPLDYMEMNPSNCIARKVSITCASPIAPSMASPSVIAPTGTAQTFIAPSVALSSIAQSDYMEMKPGQSSANNSSAVGINTTGSNIATLQISTSNGNTRTSLIARTGVNMQLGQIIKITNTTGNVKGQNTTVNDRYTSDSSDAKVSNQSGYSFMGTNVPSQPGESLRTTASSESGYSFMGTAVPCQSEASITVSQNTTAILEYMNVKPLACSTNQTSVRVSAGANITITDQIRGNVSVSSENQDSSASASGTQHSTQSMSNNRSIKLTTSEIRRNFLSDILSNSVSTSDIISNTPTAGSSSIVDTQNNTTNNRSITTANTSNTINSNKSNAALNTNTLSASGNSSSNLITNLSANPTESDLVTNPSENNSINLTLSNTRSDGASTQLTYATLDLSESDETRRPLCSSRSGGDHVYTEIDFDATARARET